MKEFGPIKEIRMPIDRKSGQLKGIAFVEFEGSVSAENSLKKDGFQLRDRRLRVTLVEERDASP